MTTTMSVFLISFAVFALAIAAMAVGVAAGRNPIRGSCGGIGSSGRCELCTRGHCRKRAQAQSETDDV